MKTRCPRCKKRYRINSETLDAVEGRVQCGRCGTIFDAVSRQAEQAEETANAIGPPLVLVTHQVSSQEQEPADDLPFAVPDDLKPLEPSADGAIDVVDTLYEKPSYRGLIYGSLATLLIGALALQLAWQYRGELLHRFPQLEVACNYLPCRPKVVHEPDSYRVLQREIAPTANEAGSLTLNATIRNDAEIAQHLPDIQLSLIDNNGAAIIRRRLAPREYLYPPPPDDRLLQPGEVFTIEIDFEDPGHIASGFTIDFF